MSPSEKLILQAMEKLGPSAASWIGMEAWAERGHISDSRVAAWARPAGAVLHRLKRQGLVKCRWDDFHKAWLWSRTRKAEAA